MSAAQPKRTNAATAKGSTDRYAIQPATTSARSGGSARADSTSWAVPRWIAPETTATTVAAAPARPVSCSHGPGLRPDSRIGGLLELPAQVAQRPCARDVRHLVEVVLGRRRG